MKKLLNLLLSLSIAVSVIQPVFAETGNITIEPEAVCGIGGYKSDHGKTDMGFRLGGTGNGAIEAYSDASLADGNGSVDIKAGFARFNLGNEAAGDDEVYTLSISGGSVISTRTGNIAVYAAAADPQTTVVSGKTPAGIEWNEISWNNRPKLTTAIDSANAVITPPNDISIDVTELLKGRTGDVTIAVLGEKVNSDGEALYKNISLKKEKKTGGDSPETPEGTGIFTFGSEYNEVKEFSTAALAETEIGDTGFKISTDTSNWNNAVVRNNMSEDNGYYPYGDGLPDKGYYLFLGSGGNSSVSARLTLPRTAKAGQYLRLTYAKPKATNNGNTDRSAANSENAVIIGGATIDMQKNCEFDTWYTSTVRLSTDVSALDFQFGKWSAAAILSVEITDSADMLELRSGADKLYILPGGSSMEFETAAYDSITVLADSGEILAKNGEEIVDAEYSVNEYSGVSIDDSGVMYVSETAVPGIVTVTAKYNGMTAQKQVTLAEMGSADSVEIFGDEIIHAGESKQYTALSFAENTSLPARGTRWEIENAYDGAEISEDGILTVAGDAEEGIITLKGTLAVSDIQTEEISSKIDITVRNSLSGESPYTVKGAVLKNGETDMASACGIDSVIIGNAGKDSEGYAVAVKVFDGFKKLIGEKSIALDDVQQGVSEVSADMEFENAAFAKAYIIKRNDNRAVSDGIFTITKGEYKNIPIVSDWITGEKSKLGMGAGIIAPQGVPYGVDPELTDTSELHIKYTYDESYQGPTSDNVLWYDEGAYLQSANGANNSIYARDSADWEQKALPIGNGYMAGMIFGLPDKDQIQINEETFWAAGYRGVQESVGSGYVNPDMSEGINGYMSVGNLFVDFDMPEGAEINNYYRDLDLDSGIAHVRYEYGGVEYKREYFASYPQESLVFRYTADRDGALNFDVKPVLMHPGDVTVNDGEITVIGKLKDSEPYSSGGNAAWAGESDLEYCVKIKVVADDGEVSDGFNSVSVDGATGVTIIVAAATDYDPDHFELNADGTVNMDAVPYKSERGVPAAIEKAERRADGAAAMNYETLKTEHTEDYKSQFDTVTFSLTDADEICGIPTDELQKSYANVVKTESVDGKTVVSYDEKAYKELNKHLEELHYNYARYLMISSSRSTTLPANLQGKWCQSTAEIWGSCYCININLEMNYWFAGGANLPDSGKALIAWLNSQIPAGRITAKNMYGITPSAYRCENGEIVFEPSDSNEDDVFIMHTKQAINGTTDMTGSTSIQSPGNTAWLMYNLWDLYQTSGDKDMLRDEIYPIMRKAANFYTQYLYTNMKRSTDDTEKYPDGYYYTTWKGRSPEHGPKQEGIKYDLQLVAGMYDYTIAAAEVLGADKEKAAAWKEIRDHLEIPVELGDDGQIKEWAQETSYNTDKDGNTLGDPEHRHISHLVGLYPGTLITRETPEFLEGAKIVLENRGDDATGWSCANKFLLWARTLDGDKALELFRYQLAQKTYANLFDTHAPFQIDGNFGAAAGVMELLMQSQTDVIYILPALPSEWDRGEISGIKAKNGAEVTIKWSGNKAYEFSIIPVSDGDVTIGYSGDFMLNGSRVSFGNNGLYTIENAEAGKKYTFTAANSSYISNHNMYDNGNGTYTIKSVTVTNKTDGAKLYAAVYAQNGVLKALDAAALDVSEGSVVDTNITFGDGDRVKMFIWDENMSPLSDIYIL